MSTGSRLAVCGGKVSLVTGLLVLIGACLLSMTLQLDYVTQPTQKRPKRPKSQGLRYIAGNHGIDISKLAVLTDVTTVGIPVLPWDTRTSFPDSSQPYFNTVMSTAEYTSSVDVMKACATALQKAGIQYMLFYGTLIGVFRHHGIIPWDWDMDILVNVSDEVRIWEVLRAINSSRYGCTRPRKIGKMRFFSRQSPKSFLRGYWPFVDIFSFAEDDKDIWWVNRNNQHFHKVDVYPLKNGLFEGSLFPVPCNPQTILKKKYNVEECLRGNRFVSNRSNNTLPERRTPCKDLQPYIPLVERETTQAHGTIETLTKDGVSLYNFTDSGYCNV